MMNEYTQKVELLSPAGDYESFIGAINAGADAVYLGGSKFGARAYADNFSVEAICMAIRYAHLWKRKVYLTVNTLLKNNELNELYNYMEPYVNAGLNGVIIQDLGVFQFLKTEFPTLELHVSTQMAVTGVYGAKFLHSLGAARIVPARELSLSEIIAIKKQVPIEIETFIHGAMCYSYSGNCLFSSMLGGRSGNRGRCAQPCRLPYSLDKQTNEQYPLSLKDMCTITKIPQLIEAGIDSFKIEGRMKKPEYTAGVTSVYRKYMDLYYHNPKGDFQIEKADMELLKDLYIRSEIQTGYYDKHNGREMVTLSTPTYEKTEENLLAEIRANYLGEKQKLMITGEIVLSSDTPAVLTLYYQDTSVSVSGEIVHKALKQPLTEETVRKQLNKTGESHFQWKQLSVSLKPDCFMTVKALNELRRLSLELLENKLLCKIAQENKRKPQTQRPSSINRQFKAKNRKDSSFQVSVLTEAQFFAVKNLPFIKRIYIDIEMLLESSLQEKLLTGIQELSEDTEIYFSLPYILRANAYKKLPQMESLLKGFPHSGIMIRNLEQAEWLLGINYEKYVVTDANLYCFNTNSIEFWKEMGVQITLPYELNEKELRHLDTENAILCVYGRIPMMITANCVSKTLDSCKKSGFSTLWLTDRYQKKFPVRCVCPSCYNVIYNSVPLFLPSQGADLQHKKGISLRLDFTTETKEDIVSIVNHFQEILSGHQPTVNNLLKHYTKGHFNRGVE